MKQAVLAELKERTYQPLAETVTKVIQLYETKNSRHSTMIVGATLSGKTVTWRVLEATLSRLSKDTESGFAAVKVRPLPLFSPNVGSKISIYERRPYLATSFINN